MKRLISATAVSLLAANSAFAGGMAPAQDWMEMMGGRGGGVMYGKNTPTQVVQALTMHEVAISEYSAPVCARPIVMMAETMQTPNK